MYKHLLLLCCFFYPHLGTATTVSWVDWSYIDSTSFDGVVDGIDVSFSGSFYDFHYPVSGGGTNFWDHPSSVAADTYSATPLVDNAPPDSDVIVMREAGTRTITFAQPVVNPVMSIVSMGSITTPVQYQFDTGFNILSVGPGTFDPSGNGTLTKLQGDILQGVEGHGLIQFTGTYTSISWDVNVYEDFHGIQIGIGSSIVPVPAAVWLFSSGLIGLIGFARRKKA
jgi:hypothetical protein